MPTTVTPKEASGIAKLRWSVAGQAEEHICTLGVGLEVPGPFPDGWAFGFDASGVANVVANAWEAAWPDTQLSTGWTWKGVDVTWWHSIPTVENPDVFPEQGSADRNVAGTAAGEPVPPNCAILVQKKTALGGRPNTGRMFLPAGCLRENIVNNVGEIAAGNVTQLQGFIDQFLTNLASITSTLFPILHHGPRMGPSGTMIDGAPPTDITALTVSSRIATQRRRMRR